MNEAMPSNPFVPGATQEGFRGAGAVGDRCAMFGVRRNPLSLNRSILGPRERPILAEEGHSRIEI